MVCQGANSESGSQVIRNTSPEVDFDFHGLCRIRLFNAHEGDIGAVSKQLGIQPAPRGGSADIVVDYEGHGGRPPHDAWLVGLDTAATADHLYIRDRSGATWTAIDLQANPGFRLTRAQGSGAIPVLTQLLAVAVRQRGIVPLHSSGFVHEGKGILVMGWSKGGKTELVLPFMEHGATFVGDEWMYVNEGRMWGLHEPIRIWDWHLDDLDRLRSRLPRKASMRLTMLAWAGALTRGAARIPVIPNGTLSRVTHLVNRQRHVQLPPAELWGDRTTQGVGIDLLVLMVSRPSSAIESMEIDAGRLADHMALSNIEEMRPLTLRSDQARFVNPDTTAMFAVDSGSEAGFIREALEGIPALVLMHPYPAPTEAMFRHLEARL